MRMLRRFVLTLVTISLLPWLAWPAAAPAGSAVQPATVHATAAQTVAPPSEARAGKGLCRIGLPVGACHLDWLPPRMAVATAPAVLHRLPPPAAGILATGRSVLPGARPPTSL